MKNITNPAALLVTLVFLFIGCGPEEESSPAAGAVLTLDETNFDAQIATGVVLVDFWATWCGPCRKQGPVVDTVAEQIGDKAKVAKLDVDVAGAIAKRFQVQSIPTLLVFKDGQPVKKFEGFTKAEELVSAIQSALGSE